MNQFVPDWGMEGNSNFRFPFSSSNQKKTTSPSNDLVELLWQNGHVVKNSQGHRKIPTVFSDFKQAQKAKPSPLCEQSLGTSSELIQYDGGASSWFQYPLDETLDREFYSEFFSEMVGIDGGGMEKLNKDAGNVKFGHSDNNNVASLSTHHQSMVHPENSIPSMPQVFAKLPNLPRPPTKDAVASSSDKLAGKVSVDGTKKGVQESSVMTVGSSMCGSNQILQQIDVSCNMSSDAVGVRPGRGPENDKTRPQLQRMRNNGYEATVTSSSGGSGCSIEGTELTNPNHKRKSIVLEESGSQSEDAEYESNDGKKSAHESKSARRSRAAEVHNLAERRRRDRINEKMKALQDLIPHCNKTDKASMLDEAIEYLKSLQLQVQMMWMGSGMAPMMFPGVQQYMPGMGMGFGHSSLPSMQNAVQLQRAPFLNQPSAPASTMNQPFLCPPPAFNGVNFPNQMPNIHLPDSYGRLFNFHQQQSESQINLNQSSAAPSSSILQNAVSGPCHGLTTSKTGK